MKQKKMGRGNISKIQNARIREVERNSAKAKRKSLMAKMENSLGAKGINELHGMKLGEKINFVLSSAWIFNAWYEKVLMLLLVYLGGWKLLNLFGFFI